MIEAHSPFAKGGQGDFNRLVFVTLNNENQFIYAAI